MIRYRFCIIFLVFYANLAHAVMETQMHPSDPWEGFNRNIFAFNESLDAYMFRPVAVVYRDFTPDVVDHSVTNFFNNISDVFTVGNSLLQLKPGKAAMHTSRIMFNTTYGLGGLIDVGTAFEITREPEDLGQTLGYWGIPSGPYLLLPVLGPSSIRDASGTLGEQAISALMFDFLADGPRYGLALLSAVDRRADVIPAEALIMGDKYSFMRNAFLQLRAWQVNDGVVVDEFSGNTDDDESYLEAF
jgi:phospholipid-binding lipoprotein MlaA